MYIPSLVLVPFLLVRVETGIVKSNQKVIVMPAGVTGEVKSLETHHTQMDSAEAGDNIRI